MTDRPKFASELVVDLNEHEFNDDYLEAEHMRYHLWVAIRKLGGRVVYPMDEFLKQVDGTKDATLHWYADHDTEDTIMVANRGEPVFVEDRYRKTLKEWWLTPHFTRLQALTVLSGFVVAALLHRAFF